MWTHADTMWTDVDCLQKCGQMRTINADSTKTRSMKEELREYVGLKIGLACHRRNL